jgi:hypothetical protein
MSSLALRLAGSPFKAPYNELLRSTLDWLHVELAIYMVSSFHLTRSARLFLAHRIRRGCPRIRKGQTEFGF